MLLAKVRVANSGQLKTKVVLDPFRLKPADKVCDTEAHVFLQISSNVREFVRKLQFRLLVSVPGRLGDFLVMPYRNFVAGDESYDFLVAKEARKKEKS